MKHLTVFKALFFAIILFGTIMGKAQTTGISYFEVDADLVYTQDPVDLAFDFDSLQQWQNGLPDTSTAAVAFIVSIDNPTQSDSLLFTLTDAQGTIVYNAGATLSSWQSGNAYRLDDNVLYLTISAGQFPYLKHFSSVATLTSGGENSSKTFNRN